MKGNNTEARTVTKALCGRLELLAASRWDSKWAWEKVDRMFGGEKIGRDEGGPRGRA